ncbi:uncharacterized protein Dwil_GK14595 [Drosophila willistoni]|uniref:Uncharacterized protein n=1 Tax=Drosophila willistoni TaxID=7260 RepID=B4MWS6_DROWI|nr:merozoite surface protein CMZ-8 [Drosophila willistoni]EDW76565.1 uncharacterized protein Dwil_GK14595 [Drosophila willistoni]
MVCRFNPFYIGPNPPQCCVPDDASSALPDCVCQPCPPETGYQEPRQNIAAACTPPSSPPSSPPPSPPPNPPPTPAGSATAGTSPSQGFSTPVNQQKMSCSASATIAVQVART